MHWLLAGFATVGAVEVMLRLPLPRTIARLQSVIRRVLRVIGSRHISDHWKELAVPAYAARLFRLTLLLALLVAIVLAPFAAALAVSVVAGIPLVDFLSSLVGIVFSTVVAAAYASLRIKGVRARL